MTGPIDTLQTYRGFDSLGGVLSTFQVTQKT